MKHALHILTGIHVAIKVIDKIHAPTVSREIYTCRRLHHPNIVQLFEVIVTENKIHMVLEYVQGGELFDWIISNGKMDQTLAKSVTKQLTQAVGYIHVNNFVHR